jgi:hypothetical protein
VINAEFLPLYGSYSALIMGAGLVGGPADGIAYGLPG